MKVKLYLENWGNYQTLEDKINNFIKNKKIIDIKFFDNKVLIMYEE